MIFGLLEEERSIQTQMLSWLVPGKNDAVGRFFRSLMAQGKVRSALVYISCKEKNIVLGLDAIILKPHGMTTRDVLKDMPPPGKQACPESLLPDSLETVNPIIYSNLDAERILHAALHTQSSALTCAWSILCSLFKSASHDLCHVLAAVGQRICSCNIHPDDLGAFVTCRLIPLKKCHGVRHIGVGEVPR